MPYRLATSLYWAFLESHIIISRETRCVKCFSMEKVHFRQEYCSAKHHFAHFFKNVFPQMRKRTALEGASRFPPALRFAQGKLFEPSDLNSAKRTPTVCSKNILCATRTKVRCISSHLSPVPKKGEPLLPLFCV